jgi:hypothetical protein
VASFGVTRWHLVKQGGRDEGGTGLLVGWAREEGTYHDDDDDYSSSCAVVVPRRS